MCGIYVNINKAGLDEKAIQDALKAIKAIDHRGPDGEGLLIINSKNGNFQIIQTDQTPSNVRGQKKISDIILKDYDTIFSHKRLSIIDLSISGHQPMFDSQSGCWIVFNGEIYNYIEIKDFLVSKNYNFTTNSDTEVILKAFDFWGTDCFRRFNGMWSICIFDCKNKKFVISNDRFGVKPLYYSFEKDSITFASEQKQIIITQGNYELNQKNINLFLRSAYLNFDENTLLTNVFRFKPSNYLVMDCESDFSVASKNQKPYYEVNIKNNLLIDLETAKKQFRELLYDAVKLRIRADVKYAFALSGGLDSSAILYAADQIFKSENKKDKIETFSAIFPNLNGDESSFMKIVEKDLGLKANYNEPLNYFNADTFYEHIWHQDAPVQSTSFFAQYSLANHVSEKGFKILIVGQGADEIFAGYHSHFYNYIRILFNNFDILKLKREIKLYCEKKGLPQKVIYLRLYNDLKQMYIYKIKGMVDGEDLQRKWLLAKNLNEILLDDLTKFAMPVYLYAGDRDNMAFGVEARHPFLDYRMVDFAFSLNDDLKIHNGWQKFIIRESMFEMPNEIRYRTDKKGFTTPQEHWLKLHLASLSKFMEYSAAYKNATSNQFRLMALGAWLKTINEHKKQRTLN